MRRRLYPTLWLLGAITIATGPVASDPAQPRSELGTEPIEWTVIESDCVLPARRSFSCGGGRVYYIDPELGDSNCSTAPFVTSEVPARYPYPKSWDDLGRDWWASEPRSGYDMLGSSLSWVAVPDVRGGHGVAVTQVVRAASEGLRTTFHAIDRGDGIITDLSVLEALCEIHELSELTSGPPVSIPLAWGRVAREEDPTGVNCDASPSLACEIAKRIGDFVYAGTVVVAAGGNYNRVRLFPATLRSVLVVGVQDVSYARATGEKVPVWESSSAVEPDALLPGHSPCIGGTWLPPGSSVSTGLLAGLVASVPGHQTAFMAQSEEPWRLVRDEDPEAGPRCYYLARGDLVMESRCFRLREFFNPLRVGPDAGCRLAGNRGRSITIDLDGLEAVEPPNVPSLPEFSSSRYVGAPEDRSCNPCIGLEDTSSNEAAPVHGNLLIDLSQSRAPHDTHLDKLYLRAGSKYYLLFDAADFEGSTLATEFDLGRVRSLHIRNLLWDDQDRQLSLYSIVKTKRDVDCWSMTAQYHSCYWSSTPILTIPMKAIGAEEKGE